MRGFRDRSDVDEVVHVLGARLQPLEAESVPLAEGAGRVLAEAVRADVDVPQFDRAAMDGYALRGEETFGATPFNCLEFKIVGEALPARPCTRPVGSGEAVRVMTGAPLPSGATAVVPVESTSEANDQLQVTEPIAPGKHVSRRGEDISRGTTVLQAGRVLRAQDLGLLASLGVATVSMHRRPTVAVLVTGNEILPCGSRPEGYRIVDSNSVMLSALVRRDGGRPLEPRLLPDDRGEIARALDVCRADVVLITGGSSVGLEDHAPSILAEQGEILAHGMALRPAGPAGVGILAGRPVFLMPGNPVSCLCAYDFFAGPSIRRLGGQSMAWPHRKIDLPLGRKLVSAIGRVDYVRVIICDGQVEPLATSGAAILSSTTRADGFVIVTRDSEGLPAGQIVTVHLYDEHPGP